MVLRLGCSRWFGERRLTIHSRGSDKFIVYRLSEADALDGQFFACTDNLTAYLKIVEMRLGSVAQGLYYTVGQSQLAVDLAGESSAEQAKPVPEQSETKAPVAQDR